MSSCLVAYRSRRGCLWLALFVVWTVCTASAARAETSTTRKDTGSGVVIGAHEILTNARVVNGCTKIIIRPSSIRSRHNVVARGEPGNSGGPLLDTSDHLTGIVSDRMSELWNLQYSGFLPRNMNFAVKTALVRTFLDSNGIAYQAARSEKHLSRAEVEETGRPFTVKIDCDSPDLGVETSPHVEGRPRVDPLPPPVQLVRILPACESPAVTNMLIRIGLKNKIAVFGVYARTLSGTADIHFCRALVSSSVGNRIVNYTITWANRETGKFWIQVTGYSGPLVSLGPPMARLPGFASPRWQGQ